MTTGLSREIIVATRHQVYDERLLEIYKRRSENLQGRKFEFLKADNCNAGTRAAVIVGGGALAGGVAGGIVGTIAGGCIAGPPGIPLGGGVGFAIGFVVGGAIGAGVAAVYLYPEYEQWLKTQEGITFGGELRAFLSERLSVYECGITHEVPIDCVRTPQGQIYERSAIIEWIEREHTDPLTRLPLHVRDLIDDNDTTFKVSQEIDLMLQEDMEHLQQHAPALVPGLQALRFDMQIRNNRFLSLQISKLEARLQAKEISIDQFRAARKALNDRYAS